MEKVVVYSFCIGHKMYVQYIPIDNRHGEARCLAQLPTFDDINDPLLIVNMNVLYTALYLAKKIAAISVDCQCPLLKPPVIFFSSVDGM
jgi:hypothetical protein